MFHVFCSPSLISAISFPRLSPQAWRPHFAFHFNLAKRPRSDSRCSLQQRLPNSLPSLTGSERLPADTSEKYLPRAMSLVESEYQLGKGTLVDASLYYVLEPAMLLAVFSLLAEYYYLLFITMVHMGQYQYYVGSGTSPRFQHKPPLRSTRCSSKTTSPLSICEPALFLCSPCCINQFILAGGRRWEWLVSVSCL